MKYVLIILLSLFILGCDDVKSDRCAEGYQVYKLDGTLTLFCERADVGKEGVWGSNCTRLEYVLSEKPVYEKIREINFREGFTVKKKCEDITPKSDNTAAADEWIKSLTKTQLTSESK